MKIFGFDFSIAKPAMCYCCTEEMKMEFYCWPMNIDEKTVSYLSSAGVNVKNRNLPKLTKKTYDNNSLVLENTKRASELSMMISDDLFSLIGETPLNDVCVCSEGLSFNSKGNQTLDLSGYKYTLLTELYRRGIRNIYTYSPITIKSIAGCAKKGNYSKDAMINAIKKTNPEQHLFIKVLATDDSALKKKTSFVHCVDDLVDAYWALRTFTEKDMK